jgi:hypothetical protein
LNALEHLRDGRFQRSLSLIVAATSVASGLEVGYEHYKGSYSNPVMYSPVLLSAALAATGAAAVFSRKAAKTYLRVISVASLVDGVIGLGFHIRGIARKPGGWRLPVTNIVMGPPIFAPLLFGTSAYLGTMASYLRREEDPPLSGPKNDAGNGEKLGGVASDWRMEISQGRFQKHLCVITIVWAFFSGFEALYSHYKSNFRYKAQWTPIMIAPVLMAAAAGAIFSRRVARTLLPAASALALADGAAGFYYHARGVARRPGGTRKMVYNILYGPPIFAPLLFAACGFLGLLASVLRREGEMKGRDQSNSTSASDQMVAHERPGYYPGYKTLEQQDSWDEATRDVVTKRVASLPPIRFFSPDDAALLQAVIDRVLPQDDRTPGKRIPILEAIDERLDKNELSGFRYDNMPPDREAYRLGLQAIDAMARERFKMPFIELSSFPQEVILKSIHDGKPDPEVATWGKLPLNRFWSMVLEDCVTAYYSHPWAWDEIGYGGPAYPRGYMRLENGLPEPWEKDEVRYVWSAPADSVSDLDLTEQTRVMRSLLLEGTH